MKSNVGGAFNKYTTWIRNRNKMKKDTVIMKINQEVVTFAYNFLNIMLEIMLRFS